MSFDLKKFIVIFALGLLWMCHEIPEYDLPSGQISAQMKVTDLGDGSNRFLVEDLTDGSFTRVWDFGDAGSPKSSKNRIDTVQYAKKGEYEIKLFVSASDGSGVATTEQSVLVNEDITVDCEGNFALFTGDCKIGCWKLSPEAGAIRVGPSPLSGEWFTSGSLEATQLDDVWCFDGETFTLDYQNNGSSFSACQGYIEDPNYPVPAPEENSWIYTAGGGLEGVDKISLENDIAWFGTEDSGPEYHIFSISESEMEVVSPIKPCDGSDSPGYFTFLFIKQQ